MPCSTGCISRRVAMTTDKLAFDVNTFNGQRRLRAYGSDAEPEGNIEWFTSRLSGNTFTITSASMNAQIEGPWPGRRYFAGPEGEGPGIYDVTGPTTTVTPARPSRGTSSSPGRAAW